MRTILKKSLITLGLLVVVFAWFSLLVDSSRAAPPRAAGETNVGFVPYTQAQRAITFSDSRHWQSTAGEILVCPHDALVGLRKTCYAKGNEGDSRWITIEQYATKFVPNAEIAGFQYSFSGSGGLQMLTIYFRKIAR